MEEFRKQSKLTGYSRDHNDTKRKEAWKEMRRVIEERRRQKKREIEPEPELENRPQEDDKEEGNSSLLNKALKEEKRREWNYRKVEEAISPASSASSTSPNSHHENGWNQGDGRRAEQLVIYEGNLPETVRSRIEPAKGTHFRFRQSSDEQKLMQALSSDSQTAVYQAKGKKDVTITSSDGQLIGNIHFLHMDGPDIHRPEKYYVKFYLFNFTDSNALRRAKQTIQQFFKGLSVSESSVSPPKHFIRQTRRARHQKRSHKKRRSHLRP
jgi:hypothetical protein